MLKDKIQEAIRLIGQLETFTTSDDINKLAKSEEALEELTACMQEILAAPVEEQKPYKEQLIGLTAQVDMLMSKLTKQRDDNRNKMNNLMKNINAQKGYTK